MDKLTKWYRPFMMGAVLLLLVMSATSWQHQSYTYNQLKSDNYFLQGTLDQMSLRLDSVEAKIRKMEETHPYLGKKWKSRKSGLCATGNFFGFLLYTPVDTSVSKDLIYTLSTYKGPTAKINSLRRHYNQSSEHYHGKAVDLAWDDGVIAFLTSEEGVSWLQEHGITLYIEGKPGSRRVKKYLADQSTAQYVFFNPNASGDHIHLNI